MKQLLIRTAAILLLCCTLLGAADAPRLSEGIYIADQADIVFREHRNFILETSLRVKLDTGAEVAVATAEDLRGLSMEAYAAEIAGDWVGGGDGSILLLYCPLTGEAFLQPGASFQEESNLFSEANAPAFLEAEMRGYLAEGKYSRAIFECYKAVVREVYRQRGIQPDSGLAASLEPNVAPNQVLWTSLAFIGAMLIMLRGFFVSRKYRRRYAAGGPAPYRRKRFSRPVRDIEFDIIRKEASGEDHDDDVRFDKD